MLGTRKLASMHNCSIFISTDLPIFSKQYDIDIEHRSTTTTVMKMASTEQTGCPSVKPPIPRCKSQLPAFHFGTSLT